tara:strand:+ start:3490 stop:3891 length:402 start_codon:yes stop_codon:yes gene_type:complete
MGNKPNLQEVNKVFQISSASKEKAIRMVRDIDKVENMESRFLKTITWEMDSIIEETKIVNPTGADLQRLDQKKDSILKSLKIEIALAQYSGIKRGILPRLMSTPKLPTTDLTNASRLIEKFEEEKRLRKELND